MVDEFSLRNQIVQLTYQALEKYPDKFAKLDDNTVAVFFELPYLSVGKNLQFEDKFNLLEIEIAKEEDYNTSTINYKLFAKGTGNVHFKYFVSDLDSKTAYKFFQTEKMIEKQDADFTLIRDTLVKEMSN